jgi:hypothetical protein
MATKIVGKLDSWESGDAGVSNFMRLEEGDNYVRCVSSPYQSYSHWVTDASGQKRKVGCCLKECPVCARGVPEESAKPRWFVAVLNRKTEKPAILEVGPQIFKGIKALASSKKWGDPRQYDLNIIKAPKGTNPLYTVMPEPKEQLEETIKATIKDWMKDVDLQAMVTAPTPDEVAEALGISLPKAAEIEAVTESVAEEFSFDD